MTYALRGARSDASHALAAPTARAIVPGALAALGLSGDPVHEPVHARGPWRLYYTEAAISTNRSAETSIRRARVCDLR